MIGRRRYGQARKCTRPGMKVRQVRWVGARRQPAEIWARAVTFLLLWVCIYCQCFVSGGTPGGGGPWAIVNEIPEENKCSGVPEALCGKRATCVVCAARRDESTWVEAIKQSGDLVMGLESLRNPMNGGWVAMYPGQDQDRSTEAIRAFVRDTTKALCTSVPLRDKLSTSSLPVAQ